MNILQKLFQGKCIPISEHGGNSSCEYEVLGCPGYVVIDDSILHPAQSYNEDGLIPKNSPNVWLTPMYFRDVWHWRRIFAQLDLITQTKERTHGKPDM